ncbi:DinB family protein [Pedobacter ureilyticus]|uniref:DinB family protein n=1 Tax=Pedobacter ureilyticus TaxID=1393051 RepID=A0ABW9JAC9_9SPHI|nr:DinB family protein [Pedobacter helvus]
MLTETLIALFERDLNRVVKELQLYKNETDIWRVEKDIANSAGNLVLHLIGNLNTYIGNEIGKTGYVRNRELEFSLKDIPREELIAQLIDTRDIVKNALSLLTTNDYDKEYPMLVLSEKTTTEFFMVHLLTHLNYHLGQINYHRRLIEK